MWFVFIGYEKIEIEQCYLLENLVYFNIKTNGIGA